MHIKNTLCLITILLAFSFSPFNFAADLIDIFRSARDHDPEWASNIAQLKAAKQILPGVEAALYPQISTAFSTKTVTTSGSGIAMINPVYLDESQLTNCIVANLKQNRACSPPLVIRDDLGGRYETYDFRIQLVQPLYNTTLWHKYNQAKVLKVRAISSHEKAKQEFILRVSVSYFAVLGSYEQWELASTEVAGVAKQLELTKKRFRLGLQPQNDVYEIIRIIFQRLNVEELIFWNNQSLQLEPVIVNL